MGLFDLFKKSTAAPPAGEATKAQSVDQGMVAATDIQGILAAMQGIERDVEPPTVATYRKMRANPTVAIARIAATAPIRSADVSIEADEDAPAGAKEFIEKQVLPLWPDFIRDSLYSLDYGWKSFEKVYATSSGWYYLRKLKPLANERTRIITSQDTGEYLGLENNGVQLPGPKTLVITNDGEDGNLYGRSRHENIREWAYSPWVQTVGQGGKYVKKNAAVIPMVTYPDGESRDKFGNTRSNFETAQAVLANLQKGSGVAMPNQLAKWAENLIAADVDVSQLAAWKISFLENNGASMLTGLVELMRHYESLMLRGWIIPESAVTIGKFGTKGQAESSIDLALTMAQGTLTEIITHANKYIVNDLMALNYGTGMDKVRIKATPLDDAKAQFLRGIVEKVLVDPANLSLLMQMVDLDQAIEQQGLPKPKDESALVVASESDGTQTAADVAAPTDATGTPEAGVATQTALNGAQVTSAVEVCQGVTAGTIAPGAATELLIAVGFTQEQAARMVAESAKAKPVETAPTNAPSIP